MVLIRKKYERCSKMMIEGEVKAIVSGEGAIQIYVGKGTAKELPKYFTGYVIIKNIKPRKTNKGVKKLKITR